MCVQACRTMRSVQCRVRDVFALHFLGHGCLQWQVVRAVLYTGKCLMLIGSWLFVRIRMHFTFSLCGACAITRQHDIVLCMHVPRHYLSIKFKMHCDKVIL